MCGIVGFLCSHGEAHESVVKRMSAQLRHRGPDDSGIWIDRLNSVALAHRRLAILDLSPAGHQPMASPCGRFILIFNGEIYNHQDLRFKLERERGNFRWRGQSDTETLLAALRHWGVKSALKELNGMFAFALWDTAERVLFLARDRMGEKPLYYGLHGNTFLFGSELKALAAHPDWRGEINHDALTLYLRHSYIPDPWCIFHGIAKIPPGHYIVAREGGRSLSGPHPYWELRDFAGAGAPVTHQSSTEVTDELDSLLRDAISRRMASDVPLGAFLSGGYDSSIVTALMQAQSEQPVKTFTIGFQEKGFDEAIYAREVATHLGTDHTELYVSPQDALAVVPKLPQIWDEPFADSSQIPTYLISQLARRNVTVALSGDGGDELFYGYRRYTVVCRFWSILRMLPAATRRRLALLFEHIPSEKLDRLNKLLPKALRFPHLGDRLQKLSEIVGQPDPQTFYKSFVSYWKKPDLLALTGTEPGTLFSSREHLPQLDDFRELMTFLDSMMYLPGDILTKVDRASMAVSLEARVPLLDHRVVEFAYHAPMSLKYQNGKGKWLLREVLYRYVPRELLDRPKKGFSVPIEHWLRGPLREWGEDLLDEYRLRENGFLDPIPIRSSWSEHVSGARRWHSQLWIILMFQAWLREHQQNMKIR